MSAAYRDPGFRPLGAQGPEVASVRDLLAAYDEDIVLRVPSLTLRGGSVYGLIGPNGAGKSTLLRTFAGLHPPTRGEVFVAGVNLQTTPPERWPRVGFMPDTTPVYERLTVSEWLRLWLKNGPARVTTDMALARVGLGGHGARRCAALSLGMRQRLGLARLLLMDAPLLLLDEPANGMDPDARQALGEVLRDEAARGAAVVVSSHVLHELDAVCDRFVMIRHGHVAGEGTTHELAGEAGDVATVRVELEAATSEARDALREALGSVESATLERFEGDTAVVRMPSGRGARAALVRALVTRGVPVCGVSEDRPHIASVYARLTRKERS